MMTDMTNFNSLEFKPDYQDTLKRYEAFWNGDIIDRPIVKVRVRNPALPPAAYTDNYYTRLHNSLEQIVDGLIDNARGVLFLGEALPSNNLSFGCDEVAAFCGGSLVFNEGQPETNWSEPFVNNWDDIMPIAIQPDNALWLRMQKFMDMCANAMAGRMLFSPLDLHTNMDLLLALRGAENLCLDLIDCPEIIDAAMEQTMAVFDELYNRAYKPYNLPGIHGITLQCDFSCMIGTSMFRRFALPYLEREAEYFGGRVLYHWDGVTALTHTDDLIASKGLSVMAFVPGAGNGPHTDYLDIYEKIQKGGKAVAVWGTADEAKIMHKRLRPEKTIYDVHVNSLKEAEDILDWFVRNT